MPATASAYKALHSFTGTVHSDGDKPSGDLVADQQGRLYGTTFQGGTQGGGTVFRLTKTGKHWNEEVLFSFSGGVRGGVTIGPAGELYGTTQIDGTANSGTVWRLDPNGAGWALTTLHTFNPSNGDGFYPEAGVVFGKDGMLYGTTTGQQPQDGGVPGPNVIYGTVFRVSPDGDPSKYAVLHVFGAAKDGQTPMHGRLAVDRKGVLTGTTALGGTGSEGMVFQLAPPKNGQTAWTYRDLHDFPGLPDAISPVSGVVQDKDGTFYGCANGGHDFAGAVYALEASGEEHVVFAFGDHANDPVAQPSCAVAIDSSGTLYGTSVSGGANANKGTVFELTPDGAGGWSETVLHSFGAGDGQNPDYAPLKRGKALYGTTELGGASGEGIVFQLKP